MSEVVRKTYTISLPTGVNVKVIGHNDRRTNMNAVSVLADQGAK